MNKPYEHIEHVTYKMITTHPYFRTLSDVELEKVVNFMNYDDYLKISGVDEKDKTRTLIAMFKKNFVLPEKWCVKRDITNYKIINKWFRDSGYGHPFLSDNYIYPVEHHNCKNYETTAFVPFIYTEITFEQFKQHVLKENMNKELVGYKLIKPEYKKTVNLILGCSENYDGILKIGINSYNDIIRIEKAGVLDLWFEPVYKQQEEKITLSNGKTVTIKDGLVYAANERLDKEALQNLYKVYYSYGGYNLLRSNLSCTQQEVILKIGCWENVKLSEIKMLMDKL